MHIDGEKAEGKNVVINWQFPDTKQQYLVKLENSVLVYNANQTASDADTTITMPKSSLDNIMLKTTNLDKEVQAGRVQIQGSREKLADLLGSMVQFNPLFNIVTP